MEQLLKKYLHEQQPLGQIIYAGVGNASSLSWILDLEFSLLHLIEPISSVASRLQRKHTANNITVTNVAISDSTGSADFTQMQPAKYSSLTQEVNLTAVLKNSQKKAVQSVETLSLSDLVQQSNLNSSDNNVLILSINGAEQASLNTVNMEALTAFSSLFIQMESKGIYNQETNASASLKASLKEKGFYFEEEQTEAIFTNLYFKRDDQVLDKIASLTTERDAAQQALQTQVAQNQQQKSELEKSQAQLEEAQANLDKQQAQLKAQLKAKQTELDSRTKALNELKEASAQQAAELEAKKAQLVERTQQRDQQAEYHENNKQQRKQDHVAVTEKANALQQKVESLQARNSDKQQALSERQNQLEQSQQALNEHKAEIIQLKEALEQQTHWHQENKNWAESLQKQLQEEKQEGQELKRSERLTQKMLVKSQVDLDDLRSKYATKVEQEQELVNLVQELRDKLTVASKYYFKLQEAHPEILAEALLVKHENEG